MIFGIQASNPRFQGERNDNDKSLSDAIESIFLLDTEYAMLIWNHIYIPISYKYDISYMIEDALELLYEIQNTESGKRVINWLPDTFRSDWVVTWEKGKIEIQSQWECTIGHLEKLLNDNNTIKVEIIDFLSEWKELFGVILKGLMNCGYDIDIIVGMRRLIEQYNNISETGILYK